MIELRKSRDKQFFFIAKAKNGQTIVTSETYGRKASAITGMKALYKAVSPNPKSISYMDMTGKKPVLRGRDI